MENVCVFCVDSYHYMNRSQNWHLLSVTILMKQGRYRVNANQTSFLLFSLNRPRIRITPKITTSV